MIEIILEDVKMPPINERKYKHLPCSGNLKKWIVIDSTVPQYSPNYIRYKGRWEETSMACYSLNKKYYRENIYQPE